MLANRSSRSRRRNEGGVSSVLGAILIFAILAIAALQYQLEWRPIQEKGAEAAHSSLVGGQMAALKAEIDRQVVNPSAASIANPVSLRGGQNGLLGGSINDRLSVTTGASSVALAAPKLTIQLADGQFTGVANETWTIVSSTGELVEDVGRIQSLRLRLLEVSRQNDTQFLTITATDSNGYAGSFRVTVLNPSGQDWRIHYRVQNRNNDTLYDNPDTFQNSVGPFQYYWVDLLEDRYRFEQVLLATSGPITLTLTKGGPDGGLGGEFSITYQSAVSGAVSGGGGSTFTPYSVSAIDTATIRYQAPNARLPQQEYVLENGALVLNQSDGAAFKVPPSVLLTAQPATTNRVTLTAPTGILQNDVLVAHVVSRGGAGLTITPPSGWSVLSRINTPGNDLASALFSRTAGASEPGSYSFALGTAGAAIGEIVSYRGASGIAATTAGAANANSTSVTAPGLTTSQANERVVGFFAVARPTAIALPASMTVRAQTMSSGATGVGAAVGDFVQGAPGPSGAQVATAGLPGVNIGHLIAVQASAIAVRGSSSATTGILQQNSLNVATPSGVLAGDLLVAEVAVRGSSTTVTAPAGWTALTPIVTQSTGTSIRVATFYRVASGTVGSHSFTFSASVKAAAGIIALTNADTQAPLNVISTNTGTSGTSTANAVTPTRANTMLVAFYGAGIATNTVVGFFSQPSGMNERYDTRSTGGADAAIAADTQSYAATTSTGNRASTMATASSNVAILAAINQAASFRLATTYTADIAGGVKLSISMPTISATPTTLSGTRSVTVQTSAVRAADFLGVGASFSMTTKTEFPGLWMDFWRQQAASVGLVENTGFQLTRAGPSVTFNLIGPQTDAQNDVVVVFQQSIVTVQLKG